MSSITQNSKWIFGPVQDVLFISSALVFTVVFYLLSFLVPQEQTPLIMLATGALLSWAHTIAPALLISDRSYAAHLKSETLKKTKNNLYKIGFLTIGFYLLGLVSLLISNASEYFYYYLLTLPFIHFGWNFYHFAKQNFGLINLYNRKLNIQNSQKWENAFCLLSTGLVIPLLNLAIIFNFFKYAPPGWLDSLLLFLSGLVFVLGLPLLTDERNSLGKQLCILVVMIQPLLLYASFNIYALVALSLPHWLTEIYLVNRLHQFGTQKETIKKSYRFLSGMIALGVFFWISSRYFIKENSLDRLFVLVVPIQKYGAYDSILVLNFIFAFVHAVPTLWHFYLDSVIYKGSSYKDPHFLAQALNLK